jgi:hypothetical protein
MTMENAIQAYIEAKTPSEILDSYEAMLQWSEAPEGHEQDDVDAMLVVLNLPSYGDKFITWEMDGLPSIWGE